MCDGITPSAVVKTYKANMAPLPDVTGIPAGTDAQGTALIVYDPTDGVFNAKLDWSGSALPPPSTTGPMGTTVIGMHIHKGDDKTNGPITTLYCGSGPLTLSDSDGCQAPPCSQTSGSVYRGFFCTGDSDPCSIPTLNAAEFENFLNMPGLYINMHTYYSFNVTQGNGLIRGQLSDVTNSENACPF